MINQTHQKQKLLELEISNARPSWASFNSYANPSTEEKLVLDIYWDFPRLSILVYNRVLQEMQHIYSITWIMKVKVQSILFHPQRR